MGSKGFDMARLSTVMADYFRSRLVGLAIGATRSPKLTTTTHRLTRRLSVEVPQGALGVSLCCLGSRAGSLCYVGGQQ